ncbi:MAG: type II secretion system F family protein [Acetatifactor sp.]|nr:type II secretion system F family protein [Acetatifactor sp.]
MWKVKETLIQLHPGKEIGELLRSYQRSKLLLCGKLLLAGMIVGILAYFSARQNGPLQDGSRVARTEYAEGTRELNLVAEAGKEAYSFHLEVQPRELTEEELQQLSDDFLNRIDALILGNNPDLASVSGELNLEDSYEGYPFTVEWGSNRPTFLYETGKVARVEEPEAVKLRVTLTYKDWSRTKELVVTLVPPVLTEEERIYEALQEELWLREGSDPTKEHWELPTAWEDKNLRWKPGGTNYPLLIWTLTPFLAVLVYFLSDRDLLQKLEEKREILREEYPGLVHKLVLYIGAGLSVRNAFERIAREYERKRGAGGKESPGNEEILRICRQLRSGVPEDSAYAQFGKRAGAREYIRLSTLLIQNQKRGNAELLARLLQEADNASSEKLLRAKKLGEEAGTKLLVPMVLLLAIVMVIIMVPAFGTM